MTKRWVWLVMVMMLSACGVIDRINDAPPASIESFTISPNPVDRGDTLTIAWSTSHADSISLRDMPFYASFGNPWMVTEQFNYTDLPATGSLTYEVPADLRRNLHFVLEVTGENGETQLVQSQEIRLHIYSCWNGIGMTCITPPQQHPVILRTYKHGYLLQQVDTGIVYLLKTDIPFWQRLTIDSFWERLTVDDPEFDAKLQSLGDELAPPEYYWSKWGQYLDHPHEVVFDYAFVSWYDGRVLTLFGQFAAERGRGWTFAELPG